MKFSESISILISPDKIWKYWLQVCTDIQWREGFTKAEWTSKAPYGIGSTGTHYHKDLGPMPWTILRWEEGQYFEFVHNRESKLKGSIASYHVEPENGGSCVTLRARFLLPFFMRIFIFFMAGKIKKSLKADLKRLKDIMEEQNI